MVGKRAFIWCEDSECFGKDSNEVGFIQLIVKSFVCHASASSITVDEVAGVTNAVLILKALKDLAKLDHELYGHGFDVHVFFILNLVDYLVFKRDSLFSTIAKPGVLNAYQILVRISTEVFIEDKLHDLCVILHNKLTYSIYRLIINISRHHSVLQKLKSVVDMDSFFNGIRRVHHISCLSVTTLSSLRC